MIINITGYRPYRRYIIASALAILTCLLFSNTVNATEDFTKKAALQALTNNCYSYMRNPINVNGYTGADSLLGDSNSEDTLPLPSGDKYSSISDETLTCHDFLVGWSGWGQSFDGIYSDKSIFNTASPNKTSSFEEKSSFLSTKAGYEDPTYNANSRNCAYFAFAQQYSMANGEHVYYDADGNRIDKAIQSARSSSFCANVDSRGNITSPEILNDGSSIFASGLVLTSDSKTLRVAKSVTRTSQYDRSTTVNYDDINLSQSWDTVISAIQGKITDSDNYYFKHYVSCTHNINTGAFGNAGNKPCPGQAKSYAYVLIGVDEYAANYDANTEVNLRTPESFKSSIISGLYGGNDILMSEQETLRLYTYYFSELYNPGIDCAINETSGYKKIKWFKQGETTPSECYVTRTDTKRTDARGGEKVNGVVNGVFANDSMDFNGLVEYFANLSVTELEEPMGDEPVEVENSAESSETTCWDNSGVLGWVICPLIEGIGSFVQFAYESLIGPMLMINASLFSPDRGTYSAWEIFRNISNIVFIIIFLVVIFSQLTGAGIDNYGIKKTLPKLVIGAILVNLSFIVCQLAVDISNIAGGGIGGLFNNIKIAAYGEGGSGGGFMAPAIVGALVIGAAGGLAVIAVIAAPIAILSALIPAAISVVFMFLLLGVRQALVVLLVAASPLAFICFILPSTKSIFDKWLKTLQTCLIAYPLCSALIYGGDLASAILTRGMTANDLPTLLTALALSVAPIFFLPSLLQKSMGAVGALAGKLQGVTKGVYGRSGLAKDLQQRRELEHAGMKYGKNGQLISTRRGRLQDKFAFTRAGRRRLDTRRGAAIKAEAELAKASGDIQDTVTRGNIVIGAARTEADLEAVKSFEASVRGGNVTGVNPSEQRSIASAYRESLASGNTVASRAYFNILSGMGASGREDVRQMTERAKADGASLESLQTLYSHAMNSQYSLDYKNSAPSTFATFAAGQTNEAVDFATTPKVDSLSPAKLANVDTQDVRRWIANFDQLNQSDRTGLVSMVNDALANDNISGSITAENKQLFQQIQALGGVNNQGNNNGQNSIGGQDGAGGQGGVAGGQGQGAG